MSSDVPRLDALDAAGGLVEDINRVDYLFFCGDLNDQFIVTGFDLVEELNRPYEMTLRLTAADSTSDCRQLLGRDVSLLLQRGVHSRTFFGIVNRVTIGESLDDRPVCTLEVVPALAALAMTRTSRIFQDKTAPEIVSEVLQAELAPYQRTVDGALLDREDYETRDYCVQYQESSLDFVHRLLEEEGIGYYFTHELDGPEALVLFDQNAHMPEAETLDGAPVPYDGSLRTWVRAEPVVQFIPTTRLAPSVVTVRDHDWTRSRPTIEARAEADGSRTSAAAKPHEVYEHGLARNVTLREDQGLVATMLELAQNALIPGGLPLGLDQMVFNLSGAVLDGFSQNDAPRQASIRRELHDRDRAAAEGVGVVMQFSAGRTFSLAGHPTLDADGDYYLTRVVHTSDAPRPEGGGPRFPDGTNYLNRFECRPKNVAWRPERRTAKPRIASVQTAKVTAPMGMDVHTDGSGRVMVRFPWDRSDEQLSGHYTCWIRVAQTWAGHGFPGFMFIPRAGMEVVVAFVDGDPDRPLVTGCVYNGGNPTPNLLPVQATKSMIRTRTVPHGPGYNELSFEDAMGIERVHLRAQRDLDELVLNDHITRVSRNQHTRVGFDQSEEVVGHQRVSVGRGRSQTVSGDVSANTSGDDHLRVGGNRIVDVSHAYELSAHDSAHTRVAEGEYVVAAKTAIVFSQDGERYVELLSEGEDKGIWIDSKGSFIHVSEDKIELRVGGSKIEITEASVQINGKTIPAS